MNAYKKSLELELTGSDQSKVDLLKSLTVKPIMIHELRLLLRAKNLLYKTRSGDWSGTIASVAHPMIDILIDAMEDPDQKTIESNKAEWAIPFKQTLDALLMNVITQEEHQVVYSLAGGLQFPDLTVTEFTSQREAGEALSSKEIVIGTAHSRVTAISGWLQAYDFAEKSLPEIETYISDLFTSPDGNPTGGV